MASAENNQLLWSHVKELRFGASAEGSFGFGTLEFRVLAGMNSSTHAIRTAITN
jgi:hypothetical protein